MTVSLVIWRYKKVSCHCRKLQENTKQDLRDNQNNIIIYNSILVDSIPKFVPEFCLKFSFKHVTGLLETFSFWKNTLHMYRLSLVTTS